MLFWYRKAAEHGYYDSFHKDHKVGDQDEDDDDEFSSQGAFRKIVWEVHPVQKIGIFP